MKLALAISNHGIMLGGGEYSFLDFISRLTPKWTALAAVPCAGELSHKLSLRGIETHAIGLPPVRPWQIFDILKTVNTYRHLCRHRQPDLIYANGSRAALYGGIVAKLKKLPLVWHCRIAERDPYLDFVLSKLSTRIIANSNATVKRFNRNSRPKIRMIHNGIDLKWFQNSVQPKPEIIGNSWINILLVARLSKMKRHDLAISAFEQVTASHSKAHLLCIGARDHSDPEWWAFLQKRSRDSAVADRIHWIGHIEDLRPWYRAAHALIFPCQNESFGRVLVEAMACGLPVVAARSGGVPEIVRHGKEGFLAAPGEEKEFSAALNKILSDEDLRRRLGQSGRKRAQLFDLDSHVNNMLSVFDEIT